MFELLKKFGVPATVASIIAALVTVIPLVFGIDGRYAKANDVEKTNHRITEIAAEINKLAGAQETLIVILSQQAARNERAVSPVRGATPPTAAVTVPPSRTFDPSVTAAPRASVPPVADPAKGDVSKQLDALRKDTQRAQARVQELQKY